MRLGKAEAGFNSYGSSDTHLVQVSKQHTAEIENLHRTMKDLRTQLAAEAETVKRIASENKGTPCVKVRWITRRFM